MSFINTSTITGSTLKFSTINAVNMTLASNGMWAGEFEDISSFAQLNVVVQTTQLGGSIVLNYSFDGAAIERTTTIPINSVNIGVLLTAGPRAPFAKISFQNGPISATISVNAFFSPTILAASSSPIINGLSGTSNGIVTKSVLYGQNPDNSFSPLNLSNDGELIVTGVTGPNGNNVTANPLFTYVTAASVAAGSGTMLQSDLITSGKTGQLTGFMVTSTSPFKASAVMVNNDVESHTFAINYVPDLSWTFTPPSTSYFTVDNNNSGFNGFRIYVTNLDIIDPSDIYVVFYYQEV